MAPLPGCKIFCRSDNSDGLGSRQFFDAEGLSAQISPKCGSVCGSPASAIELGALLDGE